MNEWLFMFLMGKFDVNSGVVLVNGMKWVFSAWNLIPVFADIDVKTAFGWADEG